MPIFLLAYLLLAPIEPEKDVPLGSAGNDLLHTPIENYISTLTDDQQPFQPTYMPITHLLFTPTPRSEDSKQ